MITVGWAEKFYDGTQKGRQALKSGPEQKRIEVSVEGKRICCATGAIESRHVQRRQTDEDGGMVKVKYRE